MSNIDYIKNVQVIGLLNMNGNDHHFTYHAHGFPSDRPPTECVVRQVNYLNDEDPMNITPYVYTVWSDMVNDNIASFVTTEGIANVCPNVTIKLNSPLSGQMIFRLNCMFATGIEREIEQSIIILNLDFIRYKN